MYASQPRNQGACAYVLVHRASTVPQEVVCIYLCKAVESASTHSRSCTHAHAQEEKNKERHAEKQNNFFNEMPNVRCGEAHSRHGNSRDRGNLRVAVPPGAALRILPLPGLDIHRSRILGKVFGGYFVLPLRTARKNLHGLGY